MGKKLDWAKEHAKLIAGTAVGVATTVALAVWWKKTPGPEKVDMPLDFGLKGIKYLQKWGGDFYDMGIEGVKVSDLGHFGDELKKLPGIGDNSEMVAVLNITNLE